MGPAPKRIKCSLERRVWTRANSRCGYCQMAQEHDGVPFEIDHVTAVSHAGPTSAENLALACFLDNSYKEANLAGIDPLTNRIIPLFNPRRQQWARHFRWNGPIVVGRTAAGRATIAVLRITFRIGSLNGRRSLSKGFFRPNPPRVLATSSCRAPWLARLGAGVLPSVFWSLRVLGLLRGEPGKPLGREGLLPLSVSRMNSAAALSVASIRRSPRSGPSTARTIVRLSAPVSLGATTVTVMRPTSPIPVFGSTMCE
jgi:hypothetical protein